MILTGQTKSVRAKPVSVSLCPPLMDWPGIEPLHLRYKASDQPPKPWHNLHIELRSEDGDCMLLRNVNRLGNEKT